MTAIESIIHAKTPELTLHETPVEDAATKVERPAQDRFELGSTRSAGTDRPVAPIPRQIAEVDLVRAAAARETARLAVRTLGAQRPDLKSSLSSLDVEGTEWPTDPAEIVDRIASLLEKQVGAERAANVRELLSDEMRFDRDSIQGFGLRPVDFPVPVVPEPIPESAGFSEGTDIDLRNHSMRDPQGYIELRIGRFVIEDLIDNRRVIEFHECGKEQTLASLRSRGFDQVMRVETPKTSRFNHLYLARSSATGEVRYARTEIYGHDRLLHEQKLFSCARRGESRILPEQVRVFSEPLVSPEKIYRRYSRALLASGAVPASVVVGFKAGLVAELGKRAVGARRLEFVQQVLGPDPIATLRQRAADAGAAGAPVQALLDQIGSLGDVLSDEPSRVFRFAKRLRKLDRVQARLSNLLAARPETAAVLGDVVGPEGLKVEIDGRVAEKVTDDSFIEQGVITYFDDEGEQRSLLTTRAPYGDLAHELGHVLVDNGVENIFVFGTAGGLKDSMRVGDLSVPSHCMNEDGVPIEIQNKAMRVIKPHAANERAQIHVGEKTADVSSPLDETGQWLDETRDAGYGVVEMELNDLVRSLKDSSANLFVAHVISDLPGKDKTLESQAVRDRRYAWSRVTDAVIDQLNMRDVRLVGDVARDTAEGFAGAKVLADRALEKRNLDGGVLQRYTVARFLLNGIGDKSIAALGNDNRDPVTSSRLAPRWRGKALRELARPYSDDQAIEHLREVTAELVDAIETLEAIGLAPDEYKLYLMGGIPKGRFGIGSDVDLVIDADPDKVDRVLHTRYGALGTERSELVSIGGYAYAVGMGANYGPMIDIGNGRQVLDDPDFLIECFADGIRPFGVAVDKSQDGRWEVRDSGYASNEAAAPERETPAIAERVLEYEKRYRGFMNTDFLVKHLDDVSGLGDVTQLPFERLVALGDALLTSRLPTALTAGNIADYLSTPDGERTLASERGQRFLQKAGGRAVLKRALRQGDVTGLPMAELIDGEMAAALIRAIDPLDCLAVDLAFGERAKTAKANGAQVGVDFAYVQAELDAAAKPAPKQSLPARAINPATLSTAAGDFLKEVDTCDPILAAELKRQQDENDVMLGMIAAKKARADGRPLRPVEKKLIERAERLVAEGVALPATFKPISRFGHRPHQTMLSLADPGRGHLEVTTKHADLLDGLILHHEYINRPNKDVAPYRMISPRQNALLRLHAADDAPVTIYYGRPNFQASIRKGEVPTTEDIAEAFDTDPITPVHDLAAAASAAFANGTADVKVAMDGMTCTQALDLMKRTDAETQRSEGQFFSAAFNINQPLVDDRPETVAEHGAPRLIDNPAEIALTAVALVEAGGWNKVTMDSATDTFPSTPVTDLLTWRGLCEWVHAAHSAGLETYVSGGIGRGISMEDERFAAVVHSGVDGLGLGFSLHVYPGPAHGIAGLVDPEKVRAVQKVRDAQEKSVRGQGARLLARLDSDFAEGTLNETDAQLRENCFRAVLEQDDVGIQRCIAEARRGGYMEGRR